MEKSWAAPRFVALACVIVCCAQGQEIHLKTRTILTAPAPDATAARPAARQRPNARQAIHQIVEFDHAPGVGDLTALLQAGAQVTGALPDNAVMVATRGGLNNLPDGAIWIGQMEAQDKISPALASTALPVSVIVEFHSDIDAAQQTALGALLGIAFERPAGLLPQHVIVEATPAILRALAAQDEVAYIFPADPTLLTGATSYPCVGMLTTAGIIAQYANVTHGWDLDSDNVAHLTYYFGSLTPKVPAATVESEIERALNTWTANLNVTFSPSTVSSIARSVYIEFASGSHGDAYPFTANGGILAHTFYPVPINAETIAGDMHFNADEPWAEGSDTDIYTVALHEAGHALGLSHSDNPGDVMYPYYHRGLPLSANDIGAAKQLYTPASVSNTQPSPVTAAPATALALTIDATPASTTAAAVSVTGIVSGGAGPYTVQWQTSQGYSGSAITSSGSDMWTASNIPLVTGANVITITAFDADDHASTQNVTIAMQQAASASGGPIAISIASPAAAVVTVSAPQVTLSGKASGGAGITQVTWQTSNGATGVATGINPWIAPAIPLPVGTTTIMVHAYDAKGATAWVAMVAVRP